MTSPDQLTRQARHNRMWMMLCLVLVVALIGMVAGMLSGRPGAAPAPAPAAEPAEPQSTTFPDLSPQTNTGGEEFEPLPGEDREEGRYEVNFPATPEGATSAMLAALDAEGTNDLSALTRAYETYFLGTWSEESVQGMVLDTRAFDMGISALGSAHGPPDVEVDEDFPGEGSYWYDQPLAIAWEVADAETIKVAVLVNQEVSDGAQFYSRHRYMHVRTLVWDLHTRGGDWMVTSIDDRGMNPTVETYEVTHESWSPIRLPDAGARLAPDESSREPA